MSRNRASETLGAYTSAGGLLPAATLRRVIEQPDTMPDGTPDGYGLPPKSKLDEHIDRAWHDARAYWNDFTARGTDAGLLDANADPTTGDRAGDPTLARLSVERLVLPLLDLLGWHDIERRPNGIEGDPDRLDADGNRMRWPVTHEAGKRNVPIHIVGYDVPLETRTRGVYGAERQSPHSTVQDLLNGSGRNLWGIAVNGRHIRLLRDSSSLTRQAYAEFDLHAMLHDGAYAEFAALWLLIHASRFTVPDADGATLADLPVERLQREATDDGIRALDHLRDGVKGAIEVLGTGLLAHPRNQTLRHALSSGELTDADFYNQVLRTVYRLVFLFAVEDRDLLHPPDADPHAVAIYAEHYSTLRLREQARRHRGGRHGDGWQHYQQLVGFLRAGQPALAIPTVAGWLWSEQAAQSIDECQVDNRSLYAALRQLSTIEQDGALHRVSYKHLGAEELGSVYESLLELTPRSDGRTFRLEEVAGNDRKTTGSYYTPTSLITRVLDESLAPVIDQAIEAALAEIDGGTAEERADVLEAAILSLTVCDPAMGSAHFLVAAAHRLAKRLAAVRTGEPEPDPGTVQTALRDVVAHCIYGVDINPMAVELAKVALWLECHTPGTPLTFLDHHLRHGDALLGLGLDDNLMAWNRGAQKKSELGGVPDAAFAAFGGDQKCPTKNQQHAKTAKGQSCPGCGHPLPCGNSVDVPAELKARNADRRGRGGNIRMGEIERHRDQPERLVKTVERINWLDDSTPDALEAKQQAWMAYRHDDELARLRLRADAWTACWTMLKTRAELAHLYATDGLSDDDLPHNVYYDTFYNGVPDDNRPGVQYVRNQQSKHAFFHWTIEFPDVAASGGFDVLIGNPPWGSLATNAVPWFINHGYEHIARAPNKAARDRLIQQLRMSTESVDRDVGSQWDTEVRRADASFRFVKGSGRFGPHNASEYSAIFGDLFLRFLKPSGRSGYLCRESVATGKSNAAFLRDVLDDRRLSAFYMFENEEFLFPAVHHDFKFALAAFVGEQLVSGRVGITGFIRQPADIDSPERRYDLTRDEIAAINPHTVNLPVFRHADDARVTAILHRNVPVLCPDGEDDPGPWGAHFNMRMFHMGDDSGFFITAHEAEADGFTREGAWYVHPDGRRLRPLHEGKMVWLYDHRYGTYDGQSDAQARQGVIPQLTDGEHNDPNHNVKHRYWVPAALAEAEMPNHWARDWMLAFRDKGTYERTMLIAAIPRVAAGHPLPLLLPERGTARQVAFLLATMASLPCDYAARQKGLRMYKYVVQQTPVLAPPATGEEVPWGGQSLLDFFVPRTVELTYTAHDLAAFANDCGLPGQPFRWNPERRHRVQSELDALTFHLYGLDRPAVEHVLSTFRVLRENEEASPNKGGFGEYRTRRLVLDRFDAMSSAMATRRYDSYLTPQPADDSLRHR